MAWRVLLYTLYFSSHNFLKSNLQVLITRAAAEEAPGRKPRSLCTRACVQLVNNCSWRKTRFLLMHRIHIRWNMPILFGAGIFHFNQKKLVWARARWKYKVSLHRICFKDYAHHSGHQEWRWRECPRRLSSRKETWRESWRKAIVTQEEDFVRRSRSGVGSSTTYMHWNRCWSREVPSFHGTDSILSLFHKYVSISPFSFGKSGLFHHFQSVISERGPSRNDSIS